MDNADHASTHADRLIEQQLAARTRYSGTSATHCDECGDAIPQRRRAAIAGCRTCTDCQRMIEHRGRP